ncbi:diaminopimelate epimerase [Clostridium massiliodielmoense]|uniref:diaminopimelate epimerase n=1 Tax=Clostridium massiliodielmoense TaxID=1776385 RepID=UPI0004DA849A|nr:diaminopimelate epimerase [Clostridium massiliodielmoense]KEH94727.1 diaminopimelate epimerase [Clostridium botulinum C/D str. BKT12695]
MDFTKMQGTGNDFVVIEDLYDDFKGKEETLAKNLCHRKFGIGADGILLVRKSSVADIKMDIINADGSYAAMCGNGIRCFARYVYDKNIVKKYIIEIETGDGIKIAYLTINNDDEVLGITINMGNFSFEPKDIPLSINEKIINRDININSKEYKITSMKLGVPHTIVMCNIDDIDVTEGKYIEKHELFSEGTNVNFCEVKDNNTISVKTWERGAGPTLACGTGSCAAVVASNTLGYIGNRCKVIVPGGELFIEIKGDIVFMTGPAEIVFEGKINI